MSLEKLFSNTKLLNIYHRYPLILDIDNKDHILVFRRLLEWSMSRGRWNGWMADKS